MRFIRMTRVFVAVCVLATGSVAFGGKIPVKTLDDLPRHAYPVTGAVSTMLLSPEAFQAFATAVRADLEGDLAAYAIEDPSTLQSMYSSLLTLDIMEHAHESARTRIEQIRALEDKEATRLTTGLTALSVIRAREETGDAEGDTYLAAFERHLRTQLAALPWDVIQTRITQQKGRVEILSETLLLGMVQAQLDPIVASSLEVSSDLAGQVLNLGYALQFALPLKQPMLKVYGEFIAGSQVIKPDIWAARDLVLTEDMKLNEVVVAVWDSGVDMPIFAGRRFTNTGETFDGLDTDGNGFVDDVHGIAFNYQGIYEPHLLYPLGEAAGRIERALDHMKGMMDLRAAIDSHEASDVRAYLSGLETDEVNVFLEDMTICSLYAHGTHVAGIVAHGNPFARLLGARISFDFHSIPELLTEEMARRHAASYGETVAYFKAHGVRVANMSWGWGLKEIEGILEANGWGDGAEARSQQARKLLDILKESLYAAIAGSPDILFVSAAGNDDNDVAFDEFIPSSFDLPNLMIVGAVDQAGEATGFTSSGENVRIYANGFEVLSQVPGGREMAFSGTSMASPNVCNLAAKLFAIAPDLSPLQVAKLIGEGADPGDGFLLMNPRRSADLLDR
jgi:hypothetical protein